MFEINFYSFSSHAHDEGVDGTEEELVELKNWKLVTEQKLKLAEQAKDEYYKLTKELKKALEDKEKEIYQAKEAAVLEYCDSDALLSELGVSYNDGFDDALRQVKALYSKLDVSYVNINVPEQTSVQHTQSKDTNELFRDDVPVTNAPVDLTVEGELKDGEAHQVNETKTPATNWSHLLLSLFLFDVRIFWEQIMVSPLYFGLCRHFPF